MVAGLQIAGFWASMVGRQRRGGASPAAGDRGVADRVATASGEKRRRAGRQVSVG
jgi:hypothetical protein